MSAEEQMRAAFNRALELGPDVDVDTLQYRGIASWDSVGHMQLVAELEATFDVFLCSDDIIDMDSLAKAREILTRYGVSFASEAEGS